MFFFIVWWFDIFVKYIIFFCCVKYIFFLLGLYFGGYKYIIIINFLIFVIKYIYICGFKSIYIIVKGGGFLFIIRFIVCLMYDYINFDVY